MRPALPSGPACDRPVAALLAALVCAFSGAAQAAADGAAPPPEPKAQQIVQEDEHVRVEELRVAGQTQHVAVQPKGPVSRPYEIVTSANGRDLGSAAEGRRGAVGQRVWSVLGF